MDRPPISPGSPPKRTHADAAVIALGSLLLAGVVAMAAAAGVPGLEPKLLKPEDAFRFSARALDARTVEARFDVADGYYLYRDRLKFGAGSGGPALGAAVLPAGKRKHDEFFGDVETYRGTLVVKVPMVDAKAGQTLVLIADSQGCADVGVCYPPNQQQVRLNVPAAGTGAGPLVEAHPRKGLFN